MRAPEGVIALLFTDIEASTVLARRLGAGWPDALDAHRDVVGGAIADEGGYVDGTEGDAFFATFADPAAAARAAVAAQRRLRELLPDIRVRMGLHVGRVDRTSTGYAGLEVHRAARVAAAAHGGQLLVTRSAVALAGDALLVEPVGVHRLKDFPEPEQLFCAVIDGRGAAAFPPPRTADVRPTNLAAVTTRLIGREGDLARVCRALTAGGERLVTLTGRGGTGKTALARAVAEAVLDAHPGGVWWVALATQPAPEGVIGAVASAVGAHGEADRPAAEAIVSHLQDRGPTLLVLDNFEHLVAAAADVAALLGALPNVRVLVTSQVPLRVSGEHCLPLDALGEEAGLQLIEYAATLAGASVTADDALRDVVRLLDGLPLGLELAAARLRVLTPAQLRERLGASLDVLHDRAPTRLDRHRSLRATLEWTLGLLDDDARRLFTRMGAFAGPVELEELETVCGADGLVVLDALAALVDVGVARRVESGDGRVRFGLPEALRQFAAERLDAASDGARWRLAHAERQLELTWPARVPMTATSVAVARADAATAEAKLALGWARRHSAACAAALAAAMGAMDAYVGRLRDAAAALQPVLEDPTSSPEVASSARVGAALLMWHLNRPAEAAAHADQAVELAPDGEQRVNALITAGAIASFAGRTDDAVRLHVAASAQARALGGAPLAGALAWEAQTRIGAGDLDRAAEALCEAERVATACGAQLRVYFATVHGELALARGNPEAALEAFAQSMLQAEARSDRLQVLGDLISMANALSEIGRDEDAVFVRGMVTAQRAAMAATAPSSSALEASSAKAAERLGAAAARVAHDRGREVPPSQLVATACRLAAMTAPVDRSRPPQSHFDPVTGSLPAVS